MSTSGELAQYRVLHFATHGALAGQLSGTTEPGLILTPPALGSEEDDGYLSASEIAGLKLDADWVILSACNTAGGSGRGDGAEALSGLARAFFYAQARALLVSHWEVNSEAAVKLITGAVGETARDATVGRAEALRRAMLALIDNGERDHGHPAYWAPFAVVGEGGASGARVGSVPAGAAAQGSAATEPVMRPARASLAPSIKPRPAKPYQAAAKSVKKLARPKATVRDDWQVKAFQP